MKCYDNYPAPIIIISNVFSLATYVLGAYVMWSMGPAWLAAYIAYVLALEMRLMKTHCVNCYYYGKYCFCGKGKLSSLLFGKGNPGRFMRKMSWKDLVPDLLVSIAPMVAGAWLLVNRFDWIVLAALAGLFLLMSVGNGFVRGSLACKYCKQRQKGCPAERLFAKKR